MNEARGVRITVTIDAATLVRLDASAKRRKRSRSTAAAEVLREAMRAVMLDAADLPPIEAAALAAIQALREKLAGTIIGARVSANPARQSREEAQGAPGGGSGRPARHWGSKARERASGAKGGGAASPKRGAESPPIRRTRAA